ncbi:hypothetical protein DFH29DRAFT_910590 [Suillus ampliporus]|nr:hypothetical protein DFH29DRAFT_910590 [Suillus ampliporus]
MGVLNHFDQFGTKNSQESVLEPTLHGTIRQALPRMDRVRIYPRFRLLIIGNTGVGKSSLIYVAFRINKVHIPEHMRGRADIDTEFIGPGNEQIVLHDSEGFEGRDSSSFQIAKEFIRRRREMPELKDQIHAVWYVVLVTTATLPCWHYLKALPLNTSCQGTFA